MLTLTADWYADRLMLWFRIYTAEILSICVAGEDDDPGGMVEDDG